MKGLKINLFVCIAFVFAFLTTNCGGKADEETANEEMRMTVIGKLQSCSELVTTKLQLRSIQRIGINNGNISLNPKTWKLDRLNNIMVILPLDVTVEYGYDLKDMDVDIVIVDDDKSEIWIYLPAPRIINSTYNPRVPKDIEVIPADAQPGQGQLSRGMQIAYQQVIANFNVSDYSQDAEHNAQTVFENILKNLNYKFTSVHIANIIDRH